MARGMSIRRKRTGKRLEAGQFLRNHLRNSHANVVIPHGAALGVGLTRISAREIWM